MKDFNQMPDTTNRLTPTPAHYPKESGNLDTVRVHCRCGNSIVIAPAFWDGDTWTCTKCGTPTNIVQSQLAAKTETHKAGSAPVVTGRISSDVKYDPTQIAKDFIVNAVTAGAHPNDPNFHDRLEAAKFIVLTAHEKGW